MSTHTDFSAHLPVAVWWIVGIGLALMLTPRITNSRHLMLVALSHVSLWRLRRIKEPGRQIHYLRQVNPFLFEEMILTALKRHGFKIKRNRRYTGDGGIDGQAWWNGQHYLIQAKRYIVDELRKQGETVDDDLLAHISLLPYKHVLPNGTYFIEQDSDEQKSS